jgi:F-type H+-transporting ATPase subunit c
MNGVVQLSIIKRMRAPSINKRIGIVRKSLYNKGRKKKEKKSRGMRHKKENLIMGNLQPLAVALAMGLAGIGAGIAMSAANGRAYEALGRNPEAAATIRMNFIIGLVFSETIAIFGLVVAMLLLLKPAS